MAFIFFGISIAQGQNSLEQQFIDIEHRMTEMTYNDVALVEQMLPTLKKAPGVKTLTQITFDFLNN